jgi:hypothetical protein
MIYLIHFDRPLHHARHYLGYSDKERIGTRILAHRLGRGAKLLAALRRAGIDWHVVRTFDGDRHRERLFKNQHNTPRLCPVCSGQVAWPLTVTAYDSLGLPEVLDPRKGADNQLNTSRHQGREDWARLRRGQEATASHEEQLRRTHEAFIRCRERAARRLAKKQAAAAAKYPMFRKHDSRRKTS